MSSSYYSYCAWIIHYIATGYTQNHRGDRSDLSEKGVHSNTQNKAITMSGLRFKAMMENLKDYDEKLLVQNLRPLLPSKYQFHINGPIIFVCTRIGDIGSALFSATKDVDEQDVTFSKEEAYALAERVYDLGFLSDSEMERQKALNVEKRQPDAESLKSYVTISSRKYLIVSCNKYWIHCRCASSRKHRGGLIIARLDKLILCCLYEAPMKSSDAFNIATAIEKKVKSLDI